MGEDANSAAIRFIEPVTGEVVVLRPDITPQIARIAASRLKDLGGPARLCYEGAVARIGSGARGQREVMQAGVELLDVGGPLADAELLALAAASLDTTLASEKSLDLGHVALAKHALASIADSDRREDLRASLVRKDRLGVAAAAKSLAPAQRRLLEALPVLFGDPRKTLKRARELSMPKAAQRALDDLESTMQLARELTNDGSTLLEELTLDLGELRGFEYYTGMRVSAYVKGAGGPVLRGGRYNNLVERYGRKAFATGFAVDIEALAQAESAQGSDLDKGAPGVLIVAEDDYRKLATDIARSLRASGLRVAVNVGHEFARGSAVALCSYAAHLELASVVRLRKTGFQFIGGDTAVQELSESIAKRAARSNPGALIELLAGSPS